VALDDALNAYGGLLDADADADADPSRVAVVGESAGAGLAAAMLVAAHAAGAAMPGCAVLFSRTRT
jgi:acetyl esterase/lipase